MTWYAVMTKPQREQTASVHLRRQGYRTFYPFVRVKRYYRRGHLKRLTYVDRPYFSRFIFAELPGPDHVGYVRKADGVSIVLNTLGRPLEIPEAVIDELMERTDSEGLVIEEAPRHWFRQKWPEAKAGDEIELADEPPYYGRTAELASLQELDKRDEVRIFFEMLGARREIVVPAKAIAKVIAA